MAQRWRPPYLTYPPTPMFALCLVCRRLDQIFAALAFLKLKNYCLNRNAGKYLHLHLHLHLRRVRVLCISVCFPITTSNSLHRVNVMIPNGEKIKTQNEETVWRQWKKQRLTHTFDPLIKWQKLRISNYYYNNNINNIIAICLRQFKTESRASAFEFLFAFVRSRSRSRSRGWESNTSREDNYYLYF